MREIPPENLCECGGWKDHRSEHCRSCFHRSMSQGRLEQVEALRSQRYTDVQIAARLGIKPVTVRGYAFRARARRRRSVW